MVAQEREMMVTKQQRDKSSWQKEEEYDDSLSMSHGASF